MGYLEMNCIYSNNEENDLIKKNGVYIAHCPTSNVNIITGICPASMYLRNGYNIGLGTDTAGGHTLDLLTVMRYAIQMSKMRYLLVDKEFKPLTLSEVLYIATYKGGSFFGKVGLFEKDYEFDALILDESLLKNLKDFNISERLERFIYSSDARIEGKFIRGNKII